MVLQYDKGERKISSKYPREIGQRYYLYSYTKFSESWTYEQDIVRVQKYSTLVKRVMTLNAEGEYEWRDMSETEDAVYTPIIISALAEKLRPWLRFWKIVYYGNC